MATTPPTELPPFPDSPGQPESVPTELPSPGPDVDYPDPGPNPGGDPGGEPFQPVDTGMTGDFA